jgi:hypothetical protein
MFGAFFNAVALSLLHAFGPSSADRVILMMLAKDLWSAFLFIDTV